MKSSIRRIMAAAALAAIACVAPRQEASPPGPGVGEPSGDADAALPPPPTRSGTRAAGTLNWEELSIRLVGRETSAGLRIDVTTLADDALAVAAPDIRAYLSDLKKRVPRTGVPVDQAAELTSFLVGYTGFEKQVGFDPTLLFIESEGSTYYPRYIIPLSEDFDRRLVDLYETVYGIYLFSPGMDLEATLEFRYGQLSSGGDWRGVVQRIQRAKARIDSQEQAGVER